MRKIWLLSIMVGLCGCATLCDAPKNIVGFSVKELEDARGQSVYRSYTCDFGQCFSAVLDVMTKEGIQVFSSNIDRGLVVLMGVPGAVDTTEVGIFFTALSDRKGVKVDVVSRSSLAKRAVAQIVFSELGKKFTKAQ